METVFSIVRGLMLSGNAHDSLNSVAASMELNNNQLYLDTAKFFTEVFVIGREPTNQRFKNRLRNIAGTLGLGKCSAALRLAVNNWMEDNAMRDNQSFDSIFNPNHRRHEGFPDIIIHDD